MTPLFVLLAAITTVWIVAGAAAVWRVRMRDDRERAASLEPISVLKPVCGVDPALEDNLRTFFEQSHSRYELVFGVQGEDDPALALVRRLRREHPEVPCRIVVHDGGRGINPKVSNLRAMLDAARHDVLVVSDSNVAVEPSYLRELGDALDQSQVGLATSLVTGVGERSTGATLDNLQLNGAIAGSVALSTHVLEHPVVVGKSMAFRRSVFERLGGFESVANVLGEDYVMGRMFHEAGYHVRLCRTPVRNVSTSTSVRGFVARQLRWAMIRLRMQPLAYALEPLQIPLFVAAVAPLFGVSGPVPLVWAVSLTLLRDAAQGLLLRESRGLLRALPLFPLRDALVLLAWLLAPFRRHVVWRGTRVRVSAGTRLYAERAPEEPSSLLVEG